MHTSLPPTPLLGHVHCLVTGPLLTTDNYQPHAALFASTGSQNAAASWESHNCFLCLTQNSVFLFKNISQEIFKFEFQFQVLEIWA